MKKFETEFWKNLLMWFVGRAAYLMIEIFSAKTNKTNKTHTTAETNNADKTNKGARAVVKRLSAKTTKIARAVFLRMPRCGKNKWRVNSSEPNFNDYKRKLVTGFRRNPKFVRVRTDRERVCECGGVGFDVSVPKTCSDCEG